MRIYTLAQIPCHTRSPLLYINLGYQIIWFPKLPSIENNVKWIIIDFSSNFTFTLSFVHHKNYVIQVKGGSAGILEKLKLLSEGVLPNSSHCRVGHYKQINIVNMISRWHRVPKLRTNGKISSNILLSLVRFKPSSFSRGGYSITTSASSSLSPQESDKMTSQQSPTKA